MDGNGGGFTPGKCEDIGIGWDIRKMKGDLDMCTALIGVVVLRK